MRDEARRLRGQGESLRAIATSLGVSLSTASVWTRGVVVPAPAGSPVAPPAVSGEVRRCSRCGLDRPAEEFNRHGSGRQWWCRACFRGYYEEGRAHHRARTNALKARRVAEAQAFVLELVRARACVDCGERDPVVLEFDHVAGEKRAHVATLVRRGVRLPVLRAEIALCQVVCVNCHRRRTAARAGPAAAPRFRSARHERNVRHVRAVLGTASCVDCGEADARVLDFDHLGPKSGTVMRLARNEVSLARLEAEIAGCAVRCANCHRRRTAVAGGHFRARAA